MVQKMRALEMKQKKLRKNMQISQSLSLCFFFFFFGSKISPAPCETGVENIVVLCANYGTHL